VDDDMRERIALDRYKVIAEALSQRLTGAERDRIVRDVCLKYSRSSATSRPSYPPSPCSSNPLLRRLTIHCGPLSKTASRIGRLGVVSGQLQVLGGE
jgi:hypothetical protein